MRRIWGAAAAGAALVLAGCQPYRATSADVPLANPPAPVIQLAPTHGADAAPLPNDAAGLAAAAQAAADAAQAAASTAAALAGGGGGGGSQTRPGSATTAADGLVAGTGPAPDGRDPGVSLGGGDLGGSGGAGTGVRGDDGSQVSPTAPQASPTPR